LVPAPLPPTYRQGSLDLVASQDYARDLDATLERVSPTVVVAEGILPYFSQELQLHLFTQTARLLQACGGGTFLADIYHQQEIDQLRGVGRIFRWGLHRFTRTDEHPMIADLHQGRALLEQAGFTRVEAHPPRAWQQTLGLPLRRQGVGLHIYEASI
jgi:O-methyltransferase involved in polyketide biosynthesis